MIEIDQEPDQFSKRPIRWSLVLAVIGIGVSIAATIALMRGDLEEVVVLDTRPPARIESDAFAFDRTTAAERLRAAVDRRLDSYGWVERASGTIHVPLEVAIEQYLGGHR
jgi:hypothetical protein